MKKLLFFCGILALLLSSCFKKTENCLPPSSGKVSEILIVLPERQWETSVGHAIKTTFTAYQEGLNQAEPIFELTQIPLKSFKGLFERNRKILRVFVSDTVTKDRLIARKEVFSSPQIIADLYAKNDSLAIRLLYSRAESLIEMFKQVERERLNIAFKSTENKKLNDNIEAHFGFRLTLPESFYEAKIADGFGWYRLEAPKYSQAIMIYTRDFKDSTQFKTPQIIAYRNTITKEYIPGQMPNSYMTTDTVLDPISRIVPFGKSTAIEVRALWQTYGDFMGGCFLNYTFLNKKRNKIITIEGYVYYPSNEKRDLLMQLEAILHSYTEK